MPDQPLRLALLGAGGRGRAVLQSWISLTDCEVVALVDPSADALERAQRKLGDAVAGAERVTDVDAWLARPGLAAQVDLVTINSWDPQHAQNAIDCFGAGLNVQVAKPMTQRTADADRVYAAWKRAGTIGVVDMQIRTSPLIRKAMEIIASGAIGTVRLVQCFDYVGRSGVEFRHTRSRRRDAIVSWTLAKGVHFLDLLNLFAGSDPVRVYATGGRDVFGGTKPNDLRCRDCDERSTCLFEGSSIRIGHEAFPNPNAGCVYSQEMDVNDNLVGAIDYRSGVRASYIECYFTPEYQTLYEIIGDRGALHVRYAMDNRLVLELRRLGTGVVEHMDISASGAHGGGDQAIVRELAAAIREGRQMHPDIRDGRYAVALCEAIDRSVEQRMPVEVPPIPGEVAALAAV